jgi:hypothetical protein
LYLVLPLFIILPVSMTDQRFLSLPHEGLSLRHYAALFASGEWFASIAQSFWIACASTILAVSAGTLFAIAAWRINRRATELLRALMLLPLIVPSIVYAIGLYRYFGWWDLLDRFAGVVIAHGVTGIPYVVITVSTALASFDVRLEQAARGVTDGRDAACDVLGEEEEEEARALDLAVEARKRGRVDGRVGDGERDAARRDGAHVERAKGREARARLGAQDVEERTEARGQVGGAELVDVGAGRRRE